MSKVNFMNIKEFQLLCLRLFCLDLYWDYSNSKRGWFIVKKGFDFKGKHTLAVDSQLGRFGFALRLTTEIMSNSEMIGQ